MTASLKPWLAFVGVAVFTIAMFGIPARATYGAQTSADEPQYLLTALSIFDDGDLDISDERYSAAYRSFHEATLPVQTELRSDGTRISPHNPLLPLLLSVPIGLGGWVAAKVTLALLGGALAALTVWVGVERLGLRRDLTVLLVLVFALSPPLAIYSTQVYPELPAAFAVTAAIAAITGTPGGRNTTLLLAAVASLPWLAVKYTPVAAALAIWGIWQMRGSIRLQVISVTVLAIAGATYLIFNQAVYGGVTPYASGDFFVGGEITALGSEPNYLGRSQRLLGLLVDRGFGLAAWQPAYLFALPAVGWALRSRRRDLKALLAFVSVGWLVATFLAQTMHGWWWPGRQLVVILPALVLLIAAWAHSSGVRPVLLAALGAVGTIAYIIIAIEAAVGSATLIVDFTETANPLYRVWSLVLPDYLNTTTTTWVLHAVWLAVALVAVWSGWREGEPNSTPAEVSAQNDLATLK